MRKYTYSDHGFSFERIDKTTAKKSIFERINYYYMPGQPQTGRAIPPGTTYKPPKP